MKVGELIRRALLYGDQQIEVRDFSTKQTFLTKHRFAFELDSEEVARIINLKVNTFEISDRGITINAE